MATTPITRYPTVTRPLRIGYRAIATSLALLAIWRGGHSRQHLCA